MNWTLLCIGILIAVLGIAIGFAGVWFGNETSNSLFSTSGPPFGWALIIAGIAIFAFGGILGFLGLRG